MKRIKPVLYGGETRIKTRFLIFPKTLHPEGRQDINETRWLETATWVDEYHDGWGMLDPWWVGKYWVDEEHD